MTNEEILDMAHELNSLSTDITALMIWIAETVEPLKQENENLKQQVKNFKNMFNDCVKKNDELQEQIFKFKNGVDK